MPIFAKRKSKISNYFYSQEVTKSKVESVSENMSSSLAPKCGLLVKSINEAWSFIMLMLQRIFGKIFKIGSLNPRRAHYYQTRKALIHSTNTAFSDQPLCVRYWLGPCEYSDKCDIQTATNRLYVHSLYILPTGF